MDMTVKEIGDIKIGYVTEDCTIRSCSNVVDGIDFRVYKAIGGRAKYIANVHLSLANLMDNINFSAKSVHEFATKFADILEYEVDEEGDCTDSEGAEIHMNISKNLDWSGLIEDIFVMGRIAIDLGHDCMKKVILLKIECRECVQFHDMMTLKISLSVNGEE